MIAKVVHISLNARGGAERLAVVTMKALSSMGIDVELATTERPDMALIRDAYGESTSLDIKRIGKLDLSNKNEKAGCDLTINTHGDMLPFFREDFTKKNSIVYCHYPTARYLTDLRDPMYSDILRDMSKCSLKYADNFSTEARNPYCKMMQNSTVLTNSEFSRKAISKEFGVDSTVLPPPVDVEIFRNAALSSDARDESVLVVSRFHQSKKLENAIRLAEMLKQNGTGRYVKIAGNMSPADTTYFDYLNDLVRQHGLEDFVKFEVNINFDRLLDLMQKAKVYFHPMPGEPFGISTVEAMSAGLIPVVPAIGGHTEFVPQKYQFRTFEEAVEAVAAAFDAPASERIQISHSTQKYSTANFVERLQRIVAEILDISKPLQSTPLILISKMDSRQSASSFDNISVNG